MSRGQSAQEEPWTAMYSRAIKLLNRYVCVHPIPVGIKDLLHGVIDMDSIMFDSLQAKNLRTTIYWSNHVQCRLQDGTRFWVLDPSDDRWPCPVFDRNKAFAIPVFHPRYEELSDWAERASECDTFMEQARIFLNHTLKRLKHPHWVEKTWPTLLPFVAGDISPQLTVNTGSVSLKQISWDFELMDKIEEAMATCTLLDKRGAVDQLGWIGDYGAGVRQ